ncbi:EI24 domain-containing protein [Aphanothece sacrum]|uniref:Uncharacterized protein n=1 Tax=Aphanothece sacrum FPU1 TaxID=1920663 RepID=A0A401IKP4_APHSA|nr:EI24 domain-containing protein [Aphanothece sacrum]GBF81810.1 hypothetical protein AsFPU1_3231 [Aphanothece sacrum FPU1]GBF84342.1 hypothetical protein AsFPU3_1391 [Aphanothece sacrum FPU3]
MQKIISGFGFFLGATYPFRLLLFFYSHPSLWSYIIVPILLNVILAIIFYLGLVIWGWQISQSLMEILINKIDLILNNLPSWLVGLEYLVMGLGFVLPILLDILLLFITGFILLQFGIILGAPWYGKLSEELERLRMGQVESIEIGVIRDIWRSILFEIKKILLFISIGIPLFLLNFFPGLGTLVSTIGGIMLTTTIICLDFFDATLERRRLKFRQKLTIIRKSLPASAGFGLISLLLISIPFVNLLTIPFCVGSGTLFICDRILVLQILPSNSNED